MSVESAESAIDRQDGNVLLFEVMALRSDALLRLVEKAGGRRTSRVILYTDLDRECASLIIRADRVMPIEVVFRGVHDERDALAAVLAAKLEPTLSAQVRNCLAPLISRLRAEAVLPIVSLFGGGPIPESTAELLRSFGVSDDTARAWCRAAGLRRPSALRWCAILARALPALRRQERATIEHVVATYAGVPVTSFRRLCKRFIGLSARAAARAPTQIVARQLAAAVTIADDGN